MNESERYHHTTHPTPPPFQSNSALHRSSSQNQYYSDNSTSTPLSRDMTTYRPPPRHHSFGQVEAIPFQRTTSTGLHNAAENNNSPDSMQWNGSSRMSAPFPNRSATYTAYSQTYSTVAASPSLYPPAPQNGTYPQQYYDSSNQDMSRTYTSEGIPIVQHSEPSLADASFPLFDNSEYLRSSANDMSIQWLFNQNQDISQLNQSLLGEFGLDPSAQISFPTTQPVPLQTSISVSSLLETPTRMSVISHNKRQQILDLIEKTFHVVDNSPVSMQREQLLSGDWDADDHVLSWQSMQRYTASYWFHFHEQIPILHKPTFSADKCQNLLLIAVLAIGAANLDKVHGQTVIASASEFANFLVWHLRGKLFEDKEFTPPTKLWVLQTLILLECYEKLYSSRFLHERSTIHHATTISLLRRGSALFGRPTTDSPYAGEENNQFIADTTETWWNWWIIKETTTRVAYALFIIDSIHAAMFGHTAVMLAHELRLPLPCDDSLWNANSGMEVGKIEQTQDSEGTKPIPFLDGLKRTLHGHPIRTNRFARTALMAGLLNVTFHLNQRDQLRQLGVVGGALEGTWRISLIKAFDIWAKDWDNDHEQSTAGYPKGRHLRESSQSSTHSASTIDEEHTFESRVVLHHLAHMMMHVEIVHCQIYARAPRLLGRPITRTEYTTTVKRMKDWAPRVTARDAVYYSLKFLRAVLVPNSQQGGMMGQQKPLPLRPAGEYTPRDDYLLNRPWVVYYAALVVWSYGYALDGPIAQSAFPKLETKEDQVADMLKFMNHVGAVSDPGDLIKLGGQRNACAGLLCFLSGQFMESRWELMKEASFLMGNCVDMLRGGDGNCAN